MGIDPLPEGRKSSVYCCKAELRAAEAPWEVGASRDGPRVQRPLGIHFRGAHAMIGRGEESGIVPSGKIVGHGDLRRGGPIAMYVEIKQGVGIDDLDRAQRDKLIAARVRHQREAPVDVAGVRDAVVVGVDVVTDVRGADRRPGDAAVGDRRAGRRGPCRRRGAARSRPPGHDLEYLPVRRNGHDLGVDHIRRTRLPGRPDPLLNGGPAVPGRRQRIIGGSPGIEYGISAVPMSGACPG